MKWIIENLVKEPSYLELSQAAKDLGFPVHDIKGDYKKADIAHYQNDDKVLFMGCIEMNKLVGDQLRKQGCAPVTYSNFDNYLCTKFYPYFGEFLFNDDYVIIPLTELKRRLYFFYGIFGKEAQVFVRPDSGDKPFKAGLLDMQDTESFFDEFKHLQNELVIVSSPKNIKAEFRFLVTDRQQILAVSSYRFNGLLTKVPSASPQATKLCEEILKIGYFPDGIFCIDIAQDNDGNCWLLELTSFSSAGLYAMDKKKVVQGVANYIG